MSSQERLLCECGNEFTEKEFSHHFGKCELFMRQFDEFDKVFGKLLKSYSHPRSRLRIIRFLIIQYIKLIDMKAPVNQISKSPSVFRGGAPRESSLPSPFQNIHNSKAPFSNNITSQNICSDCQKRNEFIYLNCVHPVCYHIFLSDAEKNIYQMKCRQCGKLIEESVKKQILGNEKYEELLKKNSSFIAPDTGRLIQCPKCKAKSFFEEGKVNYNDKDANGKKMTKQACEDFAKHRVRCYNCQNNFCVECKCMPYHLGKTCLEYKNFISSVKCRFCDKVIKNENKGPDNDVCNDPDCKERYTFCCKKVLPCGHKCFGVKNERNCPPCLDKECKDFHGNFDQSKDDYCPICFTEGLGSAPTAVLSCGHYVHYHCLKQRLISKWNGPNITFAHNMCPSCNKWFYCKDIPELQKMIDENGKLYQKVREMALKRLEDEHLDKDPRLTDKNSPWYGKKTEFAMKRLSFYQCYVCKNPYFAGRRECGDNPDVAGGGRGRGNGNIKESFDPKQLICGNHANLSQVKGFTNCKTHGKDYVVYKCKFCCNIATWFCWGDTHFCEECHKRQCAGDYVSKIPKNQLPRCDQRQCPSGGNHPPNGEEYGLWCSICKSEKEDREKK